MIINYPPTAVINLIHDILGRITFARELGEAAAIKPDLFELYEAVEKELMNLESTIEIGEFSLDFVNQLARSLDKLTEGFPSSYGPGERVPITLQEVEKPIFKQQQERNEPIIKSALLRFISTADFFTKLDFLNRDLIIVGANGSGKTSFAKQLTTHIKGNGILISAQRILTLAEYESIRSYTTTADHVKSIQLPGKELMNHSNSANEFGILIEHLLADDSRALKQNRIQRDNPLPPPTKLQVLLTMWNSLFSHLKISLPDDINIEAKKESMAFHVSEMSDGEKVALYLIAHVLLCPENGFVIVDEPEMYLHPTIHKKLWDKLEAERSDAIFIYLTHDLEFASGRVNAKKLWLRSFTYPEQFQLEEIPKNEIPQALLMELLGSRQDILFCEGEAGSLDEQIYGILFPSHTIKPVGGCLSVINYTKAFNKLPMSNRKAVGLVDGDYLSQKRLESLKGESIFAISMPDIENLLLDDTILSNLANELSCSDDTIDRIKQDILRKLNNERDTEIAKYVSAKVDYYFKDTNVSSGKTLEALKANYQGFTKEIDIDRWAQERARQIDEVISKRDYLGAIQIFKNKGLASIVNQHFGIKDFTRRATDLLRRSERLRLEVLKYTPVPS